MVLSSETIRGLEVHFEALKGLFDLSSIAMLEGQGLKKPSKNMRDLVRLNKLISTGLF